MTGGRSPGFAFGPVVGTSAGTVGLAGALDVGVDGGGLDVGTAVELPGSNGDDDVGSAPLLVHEDSSAATRANVAMPPIGRTGRSCPTPRLPAPRCRQPVDGVRRATVVTA